jgi:hypothetical protein
MVDMTGLRQPEGTFGQDVSRLDVLRLPMPGEEFGPECSERRLLDWRLPRIEDPVATAWFRWRVGHQTTFCVWRLLSECLAELAERPSPPSDLVQVTALLYDVYSLLLVYSGSCSPQEYETAIRPEMAAADGGFSGRWARDFEPVPKRLRALKKLAPSAAVAPITEASKANLVVHMAVAHRLTRGGDSLLRTSGQTEAAVTDDQRDLYDSFFHVERARICRREFAVQLFRLCMVVLDDLAERPLQACTNLFVHPSATNATIERRVSDGPANLWKLVTSSYLGRKRCCHD